MKPIAPPSPKRKLNPSRKQIRPFPNLAKQMAEVQVLREKVRKVEARIARFVN
jgi:hypothetical protein